MLFMIFTTTVVNAHALSHLFEGNNSSIEHCQTCDEYVSSSQEDYNFSLPVIQEPEFEYLKVDIEVSISTYLECPVIIKKSGKYYNKPPPFKLV